LRLLNHVSGFVRHETGIAAALIGSQPDLIAMGESFGVHLPGKDAIGVS
jgi:hypothetical protein